MPYTALIAIHFEMSLQPDLGHLPHDVSTLLKAKCINETGSQYTFSSDFSFCICHCKGLSRLLIWLESLWC